ARGSQRAHEQQAQHRSPQRVKAIPLAPRFQGHEEEVRLLKGGKPRAALLFADPAHDGTQRSREALQDAGVQQKGLHRLRLVGEDLLAQILDQVAVRAQALGEKRTATWSSIWARRSSPTSLRRCSPFCCTPASWSASRLRCVPS